LPFSRLGYEVGESNLIITCTGANDSILKIEFFSLNQEYTILSSPSDGRDDVKLLPNVKYIRVGRFKSIYRANMRKGVEGLNEASSIDFKDWNDCLSF
jgi:glutamyl-tRNA reductase